jgi:SEC-C motif-containing protein
MPNTLCVCGSQKNYDACCGLFLSGAQLPQTPEQLMRSRYAAYCVANVDYIEATMRGLVANHFNKEQARQWAANVIWQGLEVKSSSQDGDEGEVGFIASFEENGKLEHIKERSAFKCIDGRWYYTDKLKSKKIGRNDPCLCGSGKKFKKCCTP